MGIEMSLEASTVVPSGLPRLDIKFGWSYVFFILLAWNFKSLGTERGVCGGDTHVLLMDARLSLSSRLASRILKVSANRKTVIKRGTLLLVLHQLHQAHVLRAPTLRNTEI